MPSGAAPRAGRRDPRRSYARGRPWVLRSIASAAFVLSSTLPFPAVFEPLPVPSCGLAVCWWCSPLPARASERLGSAPQLTKARCSSCRANKERQTAGLWEEQQLLSGDPKPHLAAGLQEKAPCTELTAELLSLEEFVRGADVRGKGLAPVEGIAGASMVRAAAAAETEHEQS